MNYVKKMCILKQVKQGFSGDGRELTGLIKVEQYGKNLAVEVSVINFAPLSSGEYYCLLADSQGRTELLPLRGKSLFNVVSELNVSGGFCGVICFVKNGVFPIAYGTNGTQVYDWRKLLSNAVEKGSGSILRTNAGGGTFSNYPSNYSSAEKENAIAYQTSMPEGQKNIAPSLNGEKKGEEQREATAQERDKKYDDERVASHDYYQKERDGEDSDGRTGMEKAGGDAHLEGGDKEQEETAGSGAEKDGDDDGVLHPFKTDGEGYYLAVRREIDELFEKYPRDERLKGCFEFSEWVRIGGEEDAPQQLIGVIYDNLRPKYIAYALPTQTPETPPEEIAEACVFVPASHFDGSKGFFVIFQSAATGECIRPDSV